MSILCGCLLAFPPVSLVTLPALSILCFYASVPRYALRHLVLFSLTPGEYPPTSTAFLTWQWHDSYLSVISSVL
jgi:hypothetical protein